MANNYKYEDSKNNIIFRSVKKPLLEFQDIIGRKDRLSFNNTAVSNINGDKPFINAIDIDWNGAEVGNTTINTTGDLLKLINSNLSDLSESSDIAINTIRHTITGYRWYNVPDTYQPRTPMWNNINIDIPLATDYHNSPERAYPTSKWSVIAENRPSSPGNWTLWLTLALKIIDIKTDTSYLNGSWSTPVRISGTDGTPGEDGKTREYIYLAFREEQTSFTNCNPNFEYSNRDKFQKDDYVPIGTNWSDNPIGISEENKFEYVCYRDYKDGAWTAFSDPILWSNWGRVGIDGDGVEYVFVGTSSYVSPPQFITPNQPYIDLNTGETVSPTDDEYLPTVTILGEDNSFSLKQCTDDPPELSENTPYIWVGKRRKTEPNENGERIWNEYEGTMSLWAKWGFNGKDGSNDIYINDEGNLIINGKDYGPIDKGETGIGIINGNPCDVESPSIGTIVYYNGNIYVYTGNISDNTLDCSGWKSIGESSGNGKYLHVAYAIDIQFNTNKIKGFTVNPLNLSSYNFEWIGLCTTDNDTDPGYSITFDSNSYIPIDNGIEKYKWNRIGGLDGNGAEWVYIRTKINIPPTVKNANVLNSDIGIIENPNGIAINGNKNESEFYPLVENIGSFIYSEGGVNNTIESNRWADDAGGPTPEWPFRWRVQRKFINGEWLNFGTVCTDGNYISSSGFKLTTDNDTIIIDDNSTAISIQNISITKLYLWDGNVNIINDSSRISVTITITHSNSNYDEVIIPLYHVISNDSWVSCSEWGESISLYGIDKFRLTKPNNSTILSIGADNITYNIVATGPNDNITTSIVLSFLVVDISDGISYSLLVTPNTLPVHHNGTNYVYSDGSTINISAIASSTNGIELLILNNNNPSTGDLYVEVKASTDDLVSVSGSNTLLTVQLPDEFTIGNTNKRIVDTIKYFNVNLYYKTENSRILVDTETIDFSIKGDKGDKGSDGLDGGTGPQGPPGYPYYLQCSPSIATFRKNSAGDIIGTLVVTCTAYDNGTINSNATISYYKKYSDGTTNNGGTLSSNGTGSITLYYGDNTPLNVINVKTNYSSLPDNQKYITGIEFEWVEKSISVTVPIIVDGRDGQASSAGYSNVIVRLYRKGNTSIDIPGNCTYTFSGSTLDGNLGSWKYFNPKGGTTWNNFVTSPELGSGQLYMTVATAYSNSGTDTISSSEWATPIAVNEDGVTASVNDPVTVFLYQRSDSTIQGGPSVDLKYNFNDGNLYINTANASNPNWLNINTISLGQDQGLLNVLNGWKQTDINDNGNLWFTHATALSSTDEDIILNSEWSVPQLLSINGTNGTNGTNGKMFFSMGTWDSNIDYGLSYDDYRIPMVFYDDGEWNNALNMNGSYYYINPKLPTGENIQGKEPTKYYFNSSFSFDYTNTGILPNSCDWVWLKASNFGVVMAQGIFSDFAKIGAGLISGDYLFTSNGTIKNISYSDGDRYEKNGQVIDSEPAYIRFDSKFPDGKESNYNIKFLDGFIVNSTVLSSSENNTIITKPFYMVKGVGYLFKCEQTDEVVTEYDGNIKHKDLAYNLLCLIDNSLCKVNPSDPDSYDFYSNGNTYSYTPSKSGYYIIKARSVTYQQSESNRASVEGKILNIILNISNNQQPLFVPNWWVDLKTGKMSAAKGNFVVESDGSVNCTGIINRRTKVLVINNSVDSREYDKAGGTSQDSYECLMSDGTITYGSELYTGGQGSEDAQVISRHYIGSGDTDIIKFKSFSLIDDGKIYLPYPEESIYKTITVYNYSSNTNITVTSLRKSGNSDTFYTKNKSTSGSLVFSDIKKIVFYSDGQYWSVIEAIKIDNNNLLYYDEWLV